MTDKVGGVLEAVLACKSSMYFKLLLMFIQSLYVHLFGIKNMGLLQSISKGKKGLTRLKNGFCFSP